MNSDILKVVFTTVMLLVLIVFFCFFMGTIMRSTFNRFEAANIVRIAQAQAEANKILSESITPELIDMKRAETGNNY